MHLVIVWPLEALTSNFLVIRKVREFIVIYLTSTFPALPPDNVKMMLLDLSFIKTIPRMKLNHCDAMLLMTEQTILLYYFLLEIEFLQMTIIVVFVISTM